jgi:hypothetical protein
MSRWSLSLIPLVVCVASGCAGERRAGGYMDSVRAAPRLTPRTTRLQRIETPTRLAVIVASTTQDTDGDGFGDRVEVSALLFGNASADAVFSNGAFMFELVPVESNGTTGPPLGAWTFEPDAVRRAEGPTMFGLPGYRFNLDLGKNAGSMQHGSANLLSVFKPASGGPLVVPTQDQRLVRIGPVG